MAALLVVLFPIAVLLFLLGMERVEAPLRRGNDTDDVERFLDSAKQEDVDAIISGGLRKAMERWRSRRFGGLLPRNGRRGRKAARRSRDIVKPEPAVLGGSSTDSSEPEDGQSGETADTSK
ncbi:hypothetical protein CLV47_103146 [Antricoccus suffuscus]|uniref:Uncharacterized protein n=2 Tax=Antricoccus suffuscus TaxID=1629062 RepID=A0A2T1A3A6_9ACTN|nr:hypothetical protein CLV47_103146 [Antricoccus suffuscus]